MTWRGCCPRARPTRRSPPPPCPRPRPRPRPSRREGAASHTQHTALSTQHSALRLSRCAGAHTIRYMNPTVTDATAGDPQANVNPTEGNGKATHNVIVRIRRQDAPDKPPRWEEFAVPRRPNMNVISCLQYIAASPVTTEGRATTVPVWDSGCLEEVCGACTMLINGKCRQSCSALVDRLDQPIT